MMMPPHVWWPIGYIYMYMTSKLIMFHAFVFYLYTKVWNISFGGESLVRSRVIKIREKKWDGLFLASIPMRRIYVKWVVSPSLPEPVISWFVLCVEMLGRTQPWRWMQNIFIKHTEILQYRSYVNSLLQNLRFPPPFVFGFSFSFLL